jgi:hypothetical protein
MPNSVPPTSLTAEAVFGAVNLTMGTDANPCLPYLQVSGYEWWAATSNDRTAATKIATTIVPFHQHTSAATNTAYRYWARTVDASGAVSDYFPNTTTSTITATPKTAAALSLTMSASAIVVPADASGTVTSFSGAASTAKVLDGATDVTAQWAFSASSAGVTVTQAGATFTLTAVAGDAGYFDVTATRSGYPSLTARVTVSEAKAGATGAAGTSAAALRLTASSQIFQVTAAGANSPASITFTAELLGGLTGTPTFSVTAGTATLTGSGLTRTLTYANLGSDTATVQATLSGSTDYVTVAKIHAGATGAAGEDAVMALLSNEAHTLQADAAGVVGSFSGAATTLTVYEGLSDVSASYAVTKADTGVTSTLSTRTVTITAMSADSGYVDITATRSGWPTIVKRFTLTKSKAGTTGGQGARGSKHFYVSGRSTWSDTEANTASAVDGGKQLNDIVTQYNSSTFSQTKFWNGSLWVTITQAIDGNLLISGSVGATQISASFVYAGAINASQVTAGTFTGRTFQTAASGRRVVIDGTENQVECYNAAGALTARLAGTTDGGIWGDSPSGSTLSAFGAVTNSSQHAYYATSAGTATGSCFYAVPNISSRGLHIVKAANNAVVACEIAVQGGTGNGIYVNNTGSSGITIYGRTTNSGSHAVVGENAAVVNSVTGGLGYLGVNPGAGAFGVYAARGGIAPFTGQHDGLLKKTGVIEAGDIVVDVRVMAKPTINDAITEVARSGEPRQATAVGVFVSRRPMGDDPPASLTEYFDTTDSSGNPVRKPRRAQRHDALPAEFDLVVINSLGEGQINVCNEGGDIAAGDFIVTSSRPGKGMRQEDGIMRNYTVARAREPATFKGPGDVQLIACIYLCG